MFGRELKSKREVHFSLEDLRKQVQPQKEEYPLICCGHLALDGPCLPITVPINQAGTCPDQPALPEVGLGLLHFSSSLILH